MKYDDDVDENKDKFDCVSLGKVKRENIFFIINTLIYSRAIRISSQFKVIAQ